MARSKEESCAKAIKWRQAALAEGSCVVCRRNDPVEGRKKCTQCLIRSREINKTYRNKLKKELFEHYGSICSCCGENNPLFLTIEHKEGNGAKHRKELNSGTAYSLIRWAKQNNWPDTLTIYCWNCNLGSFYNGGVCPHKEVT